MIKDNIQYFINTFNNNTCFYNEENKYNTNPH